MATQIRHKNKTKTALDDMAGNVLNNTTTKGWSEPAKEMWDKKMKSSLENVTQVALGNNITETSTWRDLTDDILDNMWTTETWTNTAELGDISASDGSITNSTYNEVDADEPNLGLTPTTIAVRYLVAFLILAVNIALIVTFIRVRSLRTKSSMLVLSLAFTDLVIGAVVQSGSIILTFDQRFITPAVQEGTCVWRQLMYLITCSVSIINITFIALERYMYIIHPYLYLRYVTTKTLGAGIAVMWTTVSAIYASTMVYFYNYKDDECGWYPGVAGPVVHTYIPFVIFLAASTVTLICYVLIAHLAWSKREEMRPAQPSGRFSSERRSLQVSTVACATALSARPSVYSISLTTAAPEAVSALDARPVSTFQEDNSAASAMTQDPDAAVGEQVAPTACPIATPQEHVPTPAPAEELVTTPTSASTQAPESEATFPLSKPSPDAREAAAQSVSSTQANAPAAKEAEPMIEQRIRATTQAAAPVAIDESPSHDLNAHVTIHAVSPANSRAVSTTTQAAAVSTTHGAPSRVQGASDTAQDASARSGASPAIQNGNNLTLAQGASPAVQNENTTKSAQDLAAPPARRKTISQIIKRRKSPLPAALNVDLRSTLRALKAPVVIFGVFFLAWGPHMFIYVLNDLGVPIPRNRRAIASNLAFGNSAMNFFVYLIFNSKFRRAVWRGILCRSA